LRKLAVALLIVALSSCSISPTVRKSIAISGSIAGAGMLGTSVALSLGKDSIIKTMISENPQKMLFYVGTSFLLSGLIALVFDLNYSDSYR
jgi:hypothetical protein